MTVIKNKAAKSNPGPVSVPEPSEETPSAERETFVDAHSGATVTIDENGEVIEETPAEKPDMKAFYRESLSGNLAKRRRVRLRDEFDGTVVKLTYDGAELGGHFDSLTEVEILDRKSGQMKPANRLKLWPLGAYRDEAAEPLLVFLGSGGAKKLGDFVAKGQIKPGDAMAVVNEGKVPIKGSDRTVREYSFFLLPDDV
jgi:hypothetical protein